MKPLPTLFTSFREAASPSYSTNYRETNWRRSPTDVLSTPGLFDLVYDETSTRVLNGPGRTGLDQPVPSLAIGPGLIGPARAWIGSGWAGLGVKEFGPGRAAQVESPGSPKKPEIKPQELSLLFIQSQDITQIL